MRRHDSGILFGMRTCVIEGCTDRVDARGLCGVHYRQARKNGTIDQYERVKIVGRKCDIEWCDRPHSGRGYCSVHLNRLHRTGTPYSRREQKAMNPPTCAVPGCDDLEASRSYCRRHYQNFLRTGDPRPYQELAVEEKIRRVGWDEVRVRPDLSPCWEWRGTRTDSGYGIFNSAVDGYTHARIHRVVYELSHGPLDQGAVIRHECDNPPCINPGHLRAGTNWQNSDDMVTRNRSGHLYEKYGGRCRNGHDMTEPGAFRIRINKRNGREYRTCVKCQYIRNKAAKARAKARAEQR